jgi:hypothetical protein
MNNLTVEILARIYFRKLQFPMRLYQRSAGWFCRVRGEQPVNKS